MPQEIPIKNTMFSESFRLAREGNFEGLGDSLRHEGVKHCIEYGLSLAAENRFIESQIERASGGKVRDPRLETHFAGLTMATPVGVAAGWDKTGKSCTGLQALGASHQWPGGVSMYGQVGLPRPRLRTFDARVGDHGVSVSLNAFGFNNPGQARFVDNIQRQRDAGKITVPVIAQVTVNKELYEKENQRMIAAMVAATIRKVAPVADGISLGLSSPNTDGMRMTQKELLRMIYGEARGATELLLDSKLAYDGGESHLDMQAELGLEAELDAFSMINTTLLAAIKKHYGAEALLGGLAGADAVYQQMALAAVKYMYNAVGHRVDINGMGGINNADQALRMMRAGASIVSIMTSIRTNGRHAFTGIQSGMVNYLDQNPQYPTIEHIVGIDTDRGTKFALAA